MASIVAPKYQIVIPKHIRESMEIEPGQRWEFIRTANCLQLVRVMTADEGFGSLRGTPNDFHREEEWADEDRRRLLGVD